MMKKEVNSTKMNKIHFLKDEPKVSLTSDEVRSLMTSVFCTALSVLL
jgi:hypothetical protein